MHDHPRDGVGSSPDVSWRHPSAAYVHVPFCAHHCGYCDFAVVAGRDDRTTVYVDAVLRELASLDSPRPVDTIFWGGGTPTYLPPRELERLLDGVRRWLPLNPGGEWSVESTPDSLDDERIRLLAEAGVNRVSVGVQSFREPMLRALDRRHTASEVRPALDRVRRRIPSISIDLIFGVPGQSLDDWRDDLLQAAELGTEHLSCYGLTYEKGTPLWRERAAGQVTPVLEETEREMFLWAHDELPRLGYEHYEISNYARPGHRCRHNEVYWANHAYYGFGLGAARYVDGLRELNTRSLDEYVSRVAAGRTPTIQSETLDPEERARETVTVQLRRREGVNRAAFFRQTNFDLDALAGRMIVRHVENGLLADNGTAVSFTRDGICVADGVLADLW